MTGIMRRLSAEPIPHLVRVSRWLALTAWAFAACSVLAVRFGGIPPLNGLLVMGLAIVIAVVAVVFALGGFVKIWRYGAPGTGINARALLLALALLVWPALMAVSAVRLPVINDVTTDTVDPPSFSRSRAAVDARQGFIPAEFDRLRATDQADNTSPFRTIVIEQTPEEVMALALKAATNLGWVIVDSVSPSGRTANGRIDCVVTTFLFKFPDDVTIRIRPGVAETRVDLRSTSRFGRHDFGVNTQRIVSFSKEIEILANAK
jgi:Protein of unknown function (DUF1499)